MDPYCIIETRQQRLRTKVMQSAGKTPVWNEWFDIDVKYIGDDLTITIWDEDVTSSDKVGECIVKLSALCVNGGLDEWFQVQYKGKSCGQIHLKGQWHPAGALNTT